ncbi:unnamed protein product [Rotaria sordida]|uniref:Uncharacterized protein n=1 Tax=Rotaria sordida TaxID=392033 RepID=A0A813TNH5_9BILA|nr:unnamed protein product [Rotaria sordida]CAF0815584.1 unnamed protein product [Rotaria sordida]CAF0831272.1 unnamed protein product [Rotaria sordida]CAF0841251.1 unnamed protein product [Rotaria sordida]CAF1009705.1 unnamed protein product [Rotaria sordida]
MKQYAYEQLGENIPALLNPKETAGGLINPTKPPKPTVGRHYVACIYDDFKAIDCLIEISPKEIDDLVKTANARRKSVI